jgi:hypothetical protein
MAVIPLTKEKIDSALALPKLGKAVETYLHLQNDLRRLDVSVGRPFQRKFSGYYRVRRGAEWQRHFYGLLEKYKATGVSFVRVLVELHEATGRMEASFSSKLVGSIHPDLPIIDSVVLKHLDLRLPLKGAENRAARINEIHKALITKFADFLDTDDGKYLTRRFRDTHGTATITEVKMLDFVLWVTREKKNA